MVNNIEARSGAASAITIASMPQVAAGQSVDASFHAGTVTVKAGVS